MASNKLVLRMQFSRASIRDFDRRAARLVKAMKEHQDAMRDMMAWKPEIERTDKPKRVRK